MIANISKFTAYKGRVHQTPNLKSQIVFAAFTNVMSTTYRTTGTIKQDIIYDNNTQNYESSNAKM